jgi:hypothetical protein
MVQFVNKFFYWISSIIVGFLKSSRFFCLPVFRCFHQTIQDSKKASCLRNRPQNTRHKYLDTAVIFSSQTNKIKPSSTPSVMNERHPSQSRMFSQADAKKKKKVFVSDVSEIFA